MLRAPSVLKAIADAPPGEILVERNPGFASTANAPGDPEVRVDAYRRNSIALSVNASRPGLVYASESFFDGWTATVNGKPARILAANYAFRAVEVGAGASRIEFRYWPPGLTTGLIVSSVSAILLIAFALALHKSNRLAPGQRERETQPAGQAEEPVRQELHRSGHA